MLSRRETLEEIENMIKVAGMSITGDGCIAEAVGGRKNRKQMEKWMKDAIPQVIF